MNSIRTFLVAWALSIGAVSASVATPIELTWVTTLNQTTGGLPGTVGETITTIITVDNGSSGILGQTWTSADFLSYRIEGASGWWAESGVLDFAFGVFATDMAGLVTSVGDWQGGYSTNGPVMTSWLGATTGGWWNNGFNEVFCTNSPFDCAWADNVAGNLVATNWTAADAAAPVPLPASLPLLLAALGAVAAVRRRKTA